MDYEHFDSFTHISSFAQTSSKKRYIDFELPNLSRSVEYVPQGILNLPKE
jgi:hypothetical protein